MILKMHTQHVWDDIGTWIFFAGIQRLNVTYGLVHRVVSKLQNDETVFSYEVYPQRIKPIRDPLTDSDLSAHAEVYFRPAEKVNYDGIWLYDTVNQSPGLIDIYPCNIIHVRWENENREQSIYVCQESYLLNDKGDTIERF